MSLKHVVDERSSENTALQAGETQNITGSVLVYNLSAVDSVRVKINYSNIMFYEHTLMRI